MSNKLGKKELKDFLDKIEAQQNHGPFPARDSEILKELREKLEENSVNYDDEPVTACPHCHSLHLKDIDGNLICFNCNSKVEESEVLVFKSIFAYIEAKKRDL